MRHLWWWLLLAVGLASGAPGAELQDLEMEDNGTLLSIRYTLTGDGPASVRLVGSLDGGTQWDFPILTVTGDAGGRVWPGEGRELVWEYRRDRPEGLADLDLLLDMRVGPAEPLPEVAAGAATYAVIPIRGTVGMHVTADLVSASLTRAAQHRVGAVVFEIHSPGGYIKELFEITRTIQAWHNRNPQTRLVAFVKSEALSAAAIIATAVESIYITPAGSIGAALAIRSEGGKVEAVEEKFSSVFRSRARSVAEAGGHEPLLVEAMTDPDLALSWGWRDGQRVFTRGTPADLSEQPDITDPQLVIASGRLLTLTGTEARECGLAAGNVETYAELGAALGTPGWQLMDDHGRALLLRREGLVAELMERVEFNMEVIREEVQDLRNLPRQRKYLKSFEMNLWDIKDAIDELTELASEHLFVAGILNRAYPEDKLGEIHGNCNKLLSEIEAIYSRGR